MSFFEEIKRRNVVRVGVAYVVIGWVLAQVAEFATDNFGAPDWVLKIFVVMLLLGLPLALFFAWAFEMTPDGIKREKDVDRSQSVTHQTGKKLDRIIIGILVITVGALVTERFIADGPEPVADEPANIEIVSSNQSIAVLPFVNMSDDDDYFADGLSEELLNLLAKIPDLKVAGRTSSFVFKNKTEDLRAIGDALGVQAVLEGSVRRSGDRLRITAQLIKVDDGFHMWSETYDRQMADIFDIQDDVAGAITDALQLQLTPAVDRSTENAEAYGLYLQALALQTYSQADDVSRAQELLDQAIALDPEFARAYELKSNFYWLEAGWIIDGPTAQKLAYESAMKALELDPTLAGARSSAGTAHPDWNWIMEFEALEAFINAEPENIGALDSLAYDFVIAGYFDESVRLAQRIIDLEPLASLGYWRKGEALLAAGRREEARASLIRATDLGDVVSFWLLGADALLDGDDERAIAWLEKYAQASGQDLTAIRLFVENVRHPENGKAYLDQWITDAVAAAVNFDEAREPYVWYLCFGYPDDAWRSIDKLSGGGKGWTNADTLEQGGMVFRRTGYTRHSEYLPYSRASALIDLWDKRGPPDHCNKDSGEWVCE